MTPLPRDGPSAVAVGAPAYATDEALVDAVRAGCTERFAELVRRHNQRLFRAVRSIVPSDCDAEDVVQHAYLRAFEHLDQFAGRAKFSTWLTRIAVHEALVRVRGAYRLRSLERRMPDEGWQTGGRPDASPEFRAIQAELRDTFDVAFDRLDDACRTVLVLRDVEGLSSREVAECVGVSELLVRVRLHRARKQLRALLGDAVDPSMTRPYAFAGLRCARMTERVMSSLRDLSARS